MSSKASLNKGMPGRTEVEVNQSALNKGTSEFLFNSFASK